MRKQEKGRMEGTKEIRKKGNNYAGRKEGRQTRKTEGKEKERG